MHVHAIRCNAAVTRLRRGTLDGTRKLVTAPGVTGRVMEDRLPRNRRRRREGALGRPATGIPGPACFGVPHAGGAIRLPNSKSFGINKIGFDIDSLSPKSDTIVANRCGEGGQLEFNKALISKRLIRR
jgi:hypothetical protein